MLKLVPGKRKRCFMNFNKKTAGQDKAEAPCKQKPYVNPIQKCCRLLRPKACLKQTEANKHKRHDLHIKQEKS